MKRENACVACFRKAKESECLDGISPLILDRLETHIIANLDLTDPRVPVALLYNRCRAKVSNIVAGRKSTFDVQLLSNYLKLALGTLKLALKTLKMALGTLKLALGTLKLARGISI